jgi:hypothetical protein
VREGGRECATGSERFEVDKKERNSPEETGFYLMLEKERKKAKVVNHFYSTIKEIDFQAMIQNWPFETNENSRNPANYFAFISAESSLTFFVIRLT